jgi:TRAP-type C4-dicarboxylate transport system substrate-binding protein
MKKQFTLFLFIALALLFFGVGQQIFAQEIVLKAVTAWPQNIADNDGLFVLQEKVNERGAGKVRIEYLGGPEVIPMMELINAVKSGVVDIGWMSAGYTVSNVPAANAIKISRYTPQEARENGVADLWNEIYETKANAHFLGKGMPGVEFHLYTIFELDSADDFKGKPIRVTPSYQDFVKALGASTITTDPADLYSALERGIVEGYGWAEFGISDWGWDEQTKYIIDPGFYQVDTLGLINLDKWNSLPDDVKEIISTAAIEVEAEMTDHFDKIFKEDREMLTGKGIEVIELPEEEAEKYRDIAYKAVMDQVLKTSPEYGQRIKELLFDEF